MSGIKITPADSWFSRCVRLRAGWACEHCGKQYSESDTGLHCSHFIGRGNYAVRFDPRNASAACYGCHIWLASNPHEHTRIFKERLGEGGYDLLIERSNQTDIGKEARRDTKKGGLGLISKHYRELFQRMEAGDELEAYF